jgi:hypothetical protein
VDYLFVESLRAGYLDGMQRWRHPGEPGGAAETQSMHVNSTLNVCREYVHCVQDRAVFAEVAVLQHKPRGQFVSAAALEVHVRAVARSVRTEHPAFVGYTDLDAIASAPTSTMAAVELCLARLWVQVRDGYVITDNELMERLSAGSVWSLRHAVSRLGHATSRGLRNVWRALNDERFIPL